MIVQNKILTSNSKRQIDLKEMICLQWQPLASQKQHENPTFQHGAYWCPCHPNKSLLLEVLGLLVLVASTGEKRDSIK
jgi:hypothetical protein